MDATSQRGDHARPHFPCALSCVYSLRGQVQWWHLVILHGFQLPEKLLAVASEVHFSVGHSSTEEEQRRQMPTDIFMINSITCSFSRLVYP